MSENTGTPGPKPWADQKARHIHRYIATYRQREIGTETETQRERERASKHSAENGRQRYRQREKKSKSKRQCREQR